MSSGPKARPLLTQVGYLPNYHVRAYVGTVPRTAKYKAEGRYSCTWYLQNETEKNGMADE